MARQHGSNGQVFVDATAGSPEVLVQIASLNAWALDLKRDRVDVTAFGDTNKQFVQGLPSYSGTFGGWWDPATSPGQLFTYVLGNAAVGLRLVPSSLSGAHYFRGPAYLDGAITVAANGAVAVNGTFDAAGDWDLIDGGSPV